MPRTTPKQLPGERNKAMKFLRMKYAHVGHVAPVTDFLRLIHDAYRSPENAFDKHDREKIEIHNAVLEELVHRLDGYLLKLRNRGDIDYFDSDPNNPIVFEDEVRKPETKRKKRRHKRFVAKYYWRDDED